MILRDKRGRFAGFVGPKKVPTAKVRAPHSTPGPHRTVEQILNDMYENFKEQNRSGKSHIAAANAMELLTLQRVNEDLNIPFTEEKTLAETLTRLETDHPEEHENKLTTQVDRVTILAPKISALLATRSRTLGPVVESEYLAKETAGINTSTADIRFIHASGETTDISLKSTISGEGTARNLGMASIKQLTGVDAATKSEAMYENVLTKIAEQNPKRAQELAAMSKTTRKHALTEEEKVHATAIGQKASAEVAKEFYGNWSGLSGSAKKEFLKAGLAADGEDRQLFIAVAHDGNATIKGAPRVPALEDVHIFYAEDNPQQVKFYAGGKLLLRVIVNCTNGQGLSPLCMRTFLK